LRLNAKYTRYIEYDHYFFLLRVGYVDNQGLGAGGGILIEILTPAIGFLNKPGRVDASGFLDVSDFLDTGSFPSALDIGSGSDSGSDLGLDLGLDLGSDSGSGLGSGSGSGLELYSEFYLDLGSDLGVLDLD